MTVETENPLPKKSRTRARKRLVQEEEPLSRKDLLLGGGLWLGCVAGGSFIAYNALDFLLGIRVSYDPGIENYSDIRPTNDAALFRAASVSFMVGESKIGHGSVIRNNDNLFLLTAGHVSNFLTQQTEFGVKIPGVGRFPLERKFFDWQKKADETDTASFYALGGEIDQQVRFAINERVLQPLTLARRAPRQQEVVVVPREELGLYTIYRVGNFLPKANLIEFNAANNQTPQLCKGDSGSPILAASLTGETFGVLSQAYNPKPTAPLAERECSPNMLFRPFNT